jgi:hypothetical protein
MEKIKMADERDRMRVDSFYIETRIHGCECADCEHSMSRIIPGNRGLHCKYKKITIDRNGECKERRIGVNG